jgi:hypothetical protein
VRAARVLLGSPLRWRQDEHVGLYGRIWRDLDVERGGQRVPDTLRARIRVERHDEPDAAAWWYRVGEGVSSSSPSMTS